MLALYGHPFSSYTWKAKIALYANETAFEFRMVDGDHPNNAAFVAAASPLGKFPVLQDENRTVFEATAIIEYLAQHYHGAARLLPDDPGEAVTTRMMDRVFDNYVMGPMQAIVAEHIRSPGMPNPVTEGHARGELDRAYRWIDSRLDRSPTDDAITLVECAAAPALFYADWVYPIPMELDRLRQWRAHLNALPAVARCIEAARPYRAFFPLGAPDRD